MRLNEGGGRRKVRLGVTKKEKQWGRGAARKTGKGWAGVGDKKPGREKKLPLLFAISGRKAKNSRLGKGPTPMAWLTEEVKKG